MSDETEIPAIDLPDHKVKAKLDLAGTTMHVGVCFDTPENMLFIQSDEMAEPTYFSMVEGDLLIAALRAAQAQE